MYTVIPSVSCDVVVNVLHYEIVVYEFEFQLQY